MSAAERLKSISNHLSQAEIQLAKQKFELEEHPIDQIRELKVAVIGAGLSGTIAGALLPAKVPGINLTIFEKNSDVGGTWLENVYPGVRCDVPANVYQSSFEPRTQWTEEFAQGPEIRSYWQGVAKKHNVYKYLKLNTLLERSEWNPETAKWNLRLKNVKTGETTTESFDFLVPAIGRFNAWKLPDYPGIEKYQGHLRHSSNWDPNFDPTGKTIAVIGNGASGIQVVPELQKVAKRLDHYARSRTWIAGSFGGNPRLAEPMYYSKEQLESFQDPDTYLDFRKELEGTFWRRFSAVFKNSPDNIQAREEFKQIMAARLKERPDLLDAIIPDFSPHCRRLTPGPGYLEALAQPNVDFIRTPIESFTETGIKTEDGVHREVDAVICSTGANVNLAPPFPIVSNGIDLSEAWRPDGTFGFPYTYLGLGVPGFPNLLFVHGPNAAGPSGTVPHSAENQVTYIARVLRKVSSEGIRTIAPSKAAADDFIEYCDAFFPRTVLSENCKSWANGGIPGGRIHGLWPGSAAHVNFVRRSPRWEDWEFSLLTKTGNRFAYFGNGWTTKELDAESDLTPYLKRADRIDLKELHENWWEL